MNIFRFQFQIPLLPKYYKKIMAVLPEVALTGKVGYVDKERDFGYKFLPKNASTSVLKALYQATHGRAHDVQAQRYKIHAWGRRNTGELESVNNRLIVIRDPVKRLMSAYSNRVRYHRALSEERIRLKHPQALKNISRFDPTLSEFINDLVGYMRVNEIRHHCEPISKSLDGVPLDFYNHIVKLEDIAELNDFFTNLYGKQVELGRWQTGGKKIPLGVLRRDEIEKIIEFYAADYELLRDYYSPDAIFSEWESNG